VKLRGRTTTPDRRRGCTLSPGARGAQPPTPHGPLQRLLGVTLVTGGTAVTVPSIGSVATGAGVGTVAAGLTNAILQGI